MGSVTIVVYLYRTMFIEQDKCAKLQMNGKRMATKGFGVNIIRYNIRAKQKTVGATAVQSSSGEEQVGDGDIEESEDHHSGFSIILKSTATLPTQYSYRIYTVNIPLLYRSFVILASCTFI